jgi:catechol 2,3-dioxygenase-like lactoylglutathione lyase family enzyme
LPTRQPAATGNGATQLVDGIGGVFIYSNDASRLAEWYRKQLGFDVQKMEGDGAFVVAFRHRRQDDPNAMTETVWAILPTAEPRTANPQQYSINYRVPNMERILAHLRANGIEPEKTENHDYGRFAWIRDPDGNRVELFEKAGQ